MDFGKVPLRDWLDDFFRKNPALDELLFDGIQGLTEISGSLRVWRSSPLLASDFKEFQDFALAQSVRWDPLHPMAGGAFSCGRGEAERHYRWHGLMKPVARDGLLFSVRRHRLDEVGWKDFVDDEVLPLLKIKLAEDHPVLVMGDTGSGKTSFLICSLRELAVQMRVAILEQDPEIPKLDPQWIRLVSQSANYSGEGAVSLSTLVDELLRLRPDRIVIGELRRDEIFAYKRALLCGHGSVWTSLHARVPEEIPDRLAELGGASRDEWLGILSRQRAMVVCLNRKSPRFRGLYQFEENQITSCL